MKTLKGEIRLAIASGPMSDMETRIYESVRGYLADKFCEFVLVADPPTRQVVQLLFERIVAENKPQEVPSE